MSLALTDFDPTRDLRHRGAQAARECADWLAWLEIEGKAADSRRYAAIGDGVTATVSEWIGRRLLQWQ